jgi:hypothetical protein
MNHQEFMMNKKIPKQRVSKPKKDMTDVVKNTANPRV